MLITIDGCSGVGKTTLVDYLVNERSFAELPFDRQFNRHLDSIAMKRDSLVNDEIVRVATAFAAYREAADVSRPFYGRYICDHFWEPAFMQLYLDTAINGNESFTYLVNSFNSFMRGYDLGRPVLSVWLDAPYTLSSRRAAARDGKTPNPNAIDLDCWQNFARRLAEQLDYFTIIEATGSATAVQRRVDKLLEQYDS